MASATLPQRQLSIQVALPLHPQLIEITQLLGVRASLWGLAGQGTFALSLSLLCPCEWDTVYRHELWKANGSPQSGPSRPRLQGSLDLLVT